MGVSSLCRQSGSSLEDTCENTAVLQHSKVGMFKDTFSTCLMGAVNDSFQYIWLNVMRVPEPLSSGQQSVQAFPSLWSFLFQRNQSSQGRTPAAWPGRSSSRLSHKKRKQFKLGWSFEVLSSFCFFLKDKHDVTRICCTCWLFGLCTANLVYQGILIFV